MQVACYGFEAISQFFHRKEPDAQKRIPPVGGLYDEEHHVGSTMIAFPFPVRKNRNALLTASC